MFRCRVAVIIFHGKIHILKVHFPRAQELKNFFRNLQKESLAKTPKAKKTSGMYAGHDAQKCLYYIGPCVFFKGGDESKKTVWFQDDESDLPGNDLALLFFPRGLWLGKFGRHAKKNIAYCDGDICILYATRKGSDVLKSCCFYV